MSHTSWVRGPAPHAHSVWLYWGIFFALVCLTLITIGAAQLDFGKFNLIVAMLIASTKALLVMGVFMHLLFDNKFLAVVVATSFMFLALFILFPILDMGSREEIDYQRGNYLPRDEKVYKHELENPKEHPLRPGLMQVPKDKLNFSKPGAH